MAGTNRLINTSKKSMKLEDSIAESLEQRCMWRRVVSL